MNTTQLLGSQQLRYSKFLAAALYSRPIMIITTTTTTSSRAIGNSTSES